MPVIEIRHPLVRRNGKLEEATWDEALRVAAVDAVERLRERVAEALDDEVVVVRHQTEGVGPEAEAVHRLPQLGEELALLRLGVGFPRSIQSIAKLAQDLIDPTEMAHLVDGDAEDRAGNIEIARRNRIFAGGIEVPDACAAIVVGHDSSTAIMRGGRYGNRLLVRIDARSQAP